RPGDLVARAGGDDLAQRPRGRQAVPARVRRALLEGRADARARRAQGARGARLRGDDAHRGSAGRGHPMDPRRDRGRPDLGSQMSQETPALSVVIPVYNEGENVVLTLRGVVEHTKTRPLEVLVVHDFDEDTTVPVVRRL